MRAEAEKTVRRAGLLAGAAKVSITPRRLGLRLGGHAGNRLASAVLDPLYSRVLYLADDRNEYALVSLDLIGLGKAWVDRIRALTPEFDPEKIIIAATHTHDSPDTLGYFGYMPPGLEIPLTSGLDPAYMNFMAEQTAASIRLARSTRKPAFISGGRIKTDGDKLTRNIRRKGYKEDEVFCLHLTDQSAKTIAVVTNYPCHPEMLGHDNTRISAEFLTPFHYQVENRLGGLSIFFQSALGGMVTGAVSRDDGTFDPVVGEDFNAQLAARLATYVETALTEKRFTFSPKRIRQVHRQVEIPVENLKFLFAAGLGLIPDELLDFRKRTVTTEVNLLQIGPARLLTMPGEVLPEMGFLFKELLDCRLPMLINLGCDELGYLLPASYFSDPEYKYERSMSVGPEAEPILVAAARECLLQVEKKPGA